MHVVAHPALLILHEEDGTGLGDDRLHGQPADVYVGPAGRAACEQDDVTSSGGEAAQGLEGRRQEASTARDRVVDVADRW